MGKALALIFAGVVAVSVYKCSNDTECPDNDIECSSETSSEPVDAGELGRDLGEKITDFGLGLLDGARKAYNDWENESREP